MVITVNKKEFKNALEIAAKVASGTGRIREYDRVYIGVDSSKPDGIFVIGKGSGGAVQIALTVKARETVTLQDGELIEFRAKEVLDELKTYDTADVVFNIIKAEHKQAAENDMLLYLGRFTEYTECFKGRIVKNDFVFTNNSETPIYAPSNIFTSCLPFVYKPDAEYTDNYWACGLNIKVKERCILVKSTDKHILSCVESDCLEWPECKVEVTLKPGALKVLSKNIVDKRNVSENIKIFPGAENEPCLIAYRNDAVYYMFSVPKINQRYQYGKALVSMACDYSIILPKSEFIDALKGFIKDFGKEHGAYFKLKTHVDYIAFKDTKGLGFEYGVAGKKQYGKTGFEIGFNAPMLLSVLKAIQWSGDEVEFSIHLNKDKKYACAGALFTNPNDENEDVKVSWYVCEVMLNAGE